MKGPRDKKRLDRNQSQSGGYTVEAICASHPRPFLGVDAVGRLRTLAAFWRSSDEAAIFRKPDLSRSSPSAAFPDTR